MIWHDARNLSVEGKGWAETESFFDRLPAKAKELVRPDVWHLSHHSAGLCVRFVTKAPFTVRWTLRYKNLAMHHMPSTGVSGVDLYARRGRRGWRYLKTGSPQFPTTMLEMPASDTEIEYLLNLPLYNGVRSVRIGIENGQALRPAPPRPGGGKPIVFYGTSITQGGCVSRPGMAYTNIVSRRLDVETINLGFSGNGKTEPEVAALLGEIDAAAYVLDSLWNMTPEMVAERIPPAVRLLRKARPATPVLLVEDCNIHDKFPTPRSARLEAAYKDLLSAGVSNLHYLRGKGVLGDDDEGTVDGCHTTDLGQLRQAEAFVNALRPILKPARAPRSRK